MRIALLTSSHHKAQEFAAALGSHGQKMTAVPIDGDGVDIAKVQALLDEGYDFVLREQTALFSGQTDQEIEGIPNDMEMVVNKSSLTAWQQGERRRLVSKQYLSGIRGFIDLDLRLSDGDVFGWDDIFVPIDANADFHAMKQENMKTSARQLNVGRFLADHVHFVNRLDMRFFPMGQDQTCEFSSKAFDFVTTNPYIEKGTSGHWLGNILGHVLDSGIFFRSSSNRKEKNYWLPGLNAGIPLTEKKDPIHEITFLFHDLMHFQLPDLIPDVGEGLARRIYVTHRVMGEALTLVLADMIFIDNLRRAGVEYDFSKRLIYPLYENMKADTSVGSLRRIVKAMAHYAIRGDDSLLRTLLKPGSEASAALEAFKEKYGRFFTEDLRWTERNFDQFESHGDYIGRWIDEVVSRQSLRDNGLTTLSTFISGLAGSRSHSEIDVFEEVFRAIFDKVVVPNIETPVMLSSAALCVSNAFKRYMIGQMSIFARYGTVLDMPAIRNKLARQVARSGILSAAEIEGMSRLYRSYVDTLEDRSLIDHSDALTYRSMHPLFPPFYVFYDAKKDHAAARGPQAFA